MDLDHGRFIGVNTRGRGAVMTRLSARRFAVLARHENVGTA